LKGMEALGAKIELDQGYVVASALPLKGTRI
jgi:UDP-N-acetylglucosamine enolpyruvyl transferase